MAGGLVSQRDNRGATNSQEVSRRWWYQRHKVVGREGEEMKERKSEVRDDGGYKSRGKVISQLACWYDIHLATGVGDTKKATLDKKVWHSQAIPYIDVATLWLHWSCCKTWITYLASLDDLIRMQKHSKRVQKALLQEDLQSGQHTSFVWCQKWKTVLVIYVTSSYGSHIYSIQETYILDVVRNMIM